MRAPSGLVIAFLTIGACRPGAPAAPAADPPRARAKVSAPILADASIANPPRPAPSTALGPAPADAILEADARGARAFATRLYKAIPSSAADNRFLSPASARIALTMAYEGARGETAEEMKKALALSNDSRAVASYVLRSWNRRETPRVVNQLWGQVGWRFLPTFLDALGASYEAPIARVDFIEAPEPSRLEINAWVERETHGKIKDLLPASPRVITSDARLVLTNAVHFKSAWAHPFGEGWTGQATFHGARDVSVRMMKTTLDVPYAELPGAKVVELPYADANTSMFVVLPEARDGLASLEVGLSEASLKTWIESPKRTLVTVMLPRFSIASSFSLKESLSAMGMPRAFDDARADFSGMDGERDLVIFDVLQKAVVAVEEQGTEAAASTGVVMVYVSGDVKLPDTKEFRADHAFLFFILDKKLGQVLFMGRVVDPSK